MRLTPGRGALSADLRNDDTGLSRGQSLLRRDARAVEGRIHIAAPSDTSVQFLAEWMGDYIRTHPRLAVTLRVGDRMHDIPREAVDIAVRYGELADSSMVSRMLVRSRRVLVASPEYLERSAPLLSPADLANHRCLAWLTRDQPKVQWTFGSPAGSAETIVVKPRSVRRRAPRSPMGAQRGRCRLQGECRRGGRHPSRKTDADCSRSMKASLFRSAL